MSIDQKSLNASLSQAFEPDTEESFIFNCYQAFWRCVRQWPQPGTKASCQKQCLHASSSLMSSLIRNGLLPIRPTCTAAESDPNKPLQIFATGESQSTSDQKAVACPSHILRCSIQSTNLICHLIFGFNAWLDQYTFFTHFKNDVSGARLLRNFQQEPPNHLRGCARQVGLRPWGKRSMPLNGQCLPIEMRIDYLRPVIFL